MNEFEIAHLAELVGGEVLGDPHRRIRSVASICDATDTDIVYLNDDRPVEELEGSQAGAALLSLELTPPNGMSCIRVSNPMLAAVRLIEVLHPRRRFFQSVSPQAYLGEGIEIGEDVGIAPGAYVGNGVRIGRGSEIHPGSVIGEGSTIGENCTINSGVHIYHDCHLGDRVILHSGVVIGADGFGYVQVPGPSPSEPVRHEKVPQIGKVIVGDDVEIGANTNIDRATLAATLIGKGTKIDNAVMIGHNSKVGKHCLLVAQVGISGSTELGDYVTIAGQAGLCGHLKIGDRATIGAQAGVVRDVPDDESVLGSPAIHGARARSSLMLIERLPELRKMLRDHERRLAEMESDCGVTSREIPVEKG